jgi:hypothetical protein
LSSANLSGREIGRSIGKASGTATICPTRAACGSAAGLHLSRDTFQRVVRDFLIGEDEQTERDSMRAVKP